MEKIQDFLKSLTERFSNPFIFSFICSWLIVNWRITIGVLFYNAQTLSKVGYDSYLTMIRCEATEWNYLWFPVILAAAYTSIFPFVKIGTASLQTLADKFTNQASLYISEGSTVPIDEYTKLTKEVEADKVELGKLLSKNRINEQEGIKLANEIDLLKIENQNHLIEIEKQKAYNQNLTSELDKINKWNSLDFISGLYRVYENSDNLDVLIKNGLWYQQNATGIPRQYKIQHYGMPQQKILVLILIPFHEEASKVLVHTIKITKFIDGLPLYGSGKDTKNNDISYTWISEA
ncbi:hypothetical protein D3C80_994260 [compost metagenome]